MLLRFSRCPPKVMSVLPNSTKSAAELLTQALGSCRFSSLSRCPVLDLSSHNCLKINPPDLLQKPRWFNCQPTFSIIFWISRCKGTRRFLFSCSSLWKWDFCFSDTLACSSISVRRFCNSCTSTVKALLEASVDEKRSWVSSVSATD